MAESKDWPGITEGSISLWAENTDPPEQESQLRRLWNGIASWARTRDADRIRIDGIDLEDPSKLVDLGFSPEPGWRRRWTQHLQADDVEPILLALREIPRLSLTVFAAESELVRVRDLSWDSVYISLTKGAPPPKSLVWN